MKRREFMALLGGAAAAWPLAARAQRSTRLRLIGVLMPLPGSDREGQRRIAALAEGLQKMGWSEGHNIAFEVRYAEGRPERLTTLAKELVDANVDLIITQAAQPVEAARKATDKIPIVMAAHGDALGSGVIASLGRPGGNVTGQTLVATEQASKRLDLIKKMYPRLLRAAILWNGNAAGHRLQMEAMEAASPVLGITLQSRPIHNSTEIDAALQAATDAKAQVIVTMDDPMIQSNRTRIVAYAMQQRLPVVGEFRPFAEAGALMSYAPDQIELWRSAAVYIDKILRGAKPGDLPVAQPTKFELLINVRTAKAIGFEVPASVLAIADEVIE
jgi:putative tryptophan/tyrosine transport system substrate-binding protein